MYVAKFSQVNSDKFKADKNGEMPFIGEVLAGVATGTIINGTMFKREGLEPNTLYACENHIDPEYPENVQTKVIAKVSVLEYPQLRATLGAGKIVVNPTVTDSDEENDLDEEVVRATQAGKGTK